VADYDGFAPFYDAVMGDRAAQVGQLTKWIDQYYEKPVESLLELGCGTGSILAGLAHIPSRTGLDRSGPMLAVARQKLPGVRLVEGDIETFDLGARFDVVVCVFDTINHLVDFGQWERLFDRANEHLVDGGLFIFDVNTIGKLRALGGSPPWVLDFDGNILIMDVEFDGHQMSTWHLRVFQPVGTDRYMLYREVVRELGMPLSEIRSALASRFQILDEIDPDGVPATDESRRVHFLCRASHGEPPS
jgi:SAM-dependent methyltransferase